jgi:hypothetical protein
MKYRVDGIVSRKSQTVTCWTDLVNNLIGLKYLKANF